MRTPEAVLSWPKLFVPEAPKPGDKPVYSATLVFLAGTDLSDMKKAAMAALVERFKLTAEEIAERTKLDSEDPDFIRWPFMDNAKKIAKKGYPEGSTAVNVKTYQKPGIVTQYADPTTGKPMPIQSEDDCRYGSIVMATVGENAYDKKGNKGVSFWLNNLQVRGSSDVLGGAAKAEDEFEADAPLADITEETPDAPAEAGSLDSLLS